MENINKSTFTITSPLSGKVIPITEVPDEAFSQKTLGDGVAIIPSDGKILSPVDGKLISVAATNHAFGFLSDDGLNILVHVGLDSVSLKGEGFKIYAKKGDNVKKGDLIAEVDLALFQKRNINPMTPVLLCNAPDNTSLKSDYSEATAGKSTIFDVIDKLFQNSDETVLSDEANSTQKAQKSSKTFDFLQKLGKVLMVVIAVMPAAGIMISLGKLISMISSDIAFLTIAGSIIENIGWAIISNLHILFAVAIGGSWAKERAGGAFAALLAFILINNITGNIFGVTNAMLSDENAVTYTLFGQQILVNGYFTSVLGSPALNMGVFVGIISGFVGL